MWTKKFPASADNQGAAATGKELILASTSPRRRELLRKLGRPFRVVAPHADESIPPGLSPSAAAETIAARKARSVASKLSRGIVLAADTIVAAPVEGSSELEIIGKPRDRSHAVQILRTLTRRSHQVITGICLIHAPSGREWIASETTAVAMRPMTRQEIQTYVDSGEAMGKAGAYAIQETGDRFVRSINGSVSNVVGLPLELVRKLLSEAERYPGETQQHEKT